MTVSQDAAGRWFVSLLCDDPSVTPLGANGNAVGIDVGLDHLLTLSTGEKVTNLRHERKDRVRLAKAMRNLAKQTRGSATEQGRRRSPGSSPDRPPQAGRPAQTDHSARA